MLPNTNSNIVEVLQKRAIGHPDRECIIFLGDGENQSDSMTYYENDEAARKVAASIQKRGISKGDRVLVILPNSLEFVKIFYGCLYSGVLAVPLHEPAGTKQIDLYMETFIPTLKISKPSLLIANIEIVDFLRKNLTPKKKEIFNGIEIASDKDILGDNDIEYIPAEIDNKDTAYLQFTSGSTGAPKGIMIGHDNIMANLEEAQKFMQLKEEKGTVVWLPLFHDFGLAAGLMGAHYSGGFVVLMTPAHFIRKPLRWLAAISKFKCAHSYVPPFALDLCMKKISEEELKNLDLSCMVSVTDGSEPVHYLPTKNFIERFSKCGLKSDVIRPGFGLAEMVIMFSGCKTGLEGVCVNRNVLEKEGRLELADESLLDADKKMLVNLGTQMDGHEIVIKGNQNQSLPEGFEGELTVSGPSVAQGYYNNFEATEEIFHQKINGKNQYFLTTGDSALIWKGELYFTGRIKDIIIIRGRNYYPHDIEQALSLVGELRPGCIIAYASKKENELEHLTTAVEVRADLIKDLVLFKDYVLPTVDKKIINIIGESFKIFPSERIYLEPGTIAKTSSGKIRHEYNRQRFVQQNFEGLVERIFNSQVREFLVDGEKNSSFESEIKTIFEKIVLLTPELDQPILDMGADSVVIVEFVDNIEKKYKQDFEVEENTTLRDIVRQINQV
ncbi:MAG: hypothetical protein CL935_05180 [Deltaproteobacteria bacterium]|nr:hypothetical protein [Deltaproteobacteria bacterium]